MLIAGLVAGCALPAGAAPRECGLDPSVAIAWSGRASLEELGLGLAGLPEVPRGQRGDVFVTELNRAGDRQYCTILTTAGGESWFVSGAAPANWRTPADLASPGG